MEKLDSSLFFAIVASIAASRWREGSLDAAAAIRRLPAVRASGEVLTAIHRV